MDLSELWWSENLMKETSQELWMLSRSLSACQSLTHNVMMSVSRFVRNSQLCHQVTKSLYSSQVFWLCLCLCLAMSPHPFDHFLAHCAPPPWPHSKSLKKFPFLTPRSLRTISEKWKEGFAWTWLASKPCSPIQTDYIRYHIYIYKPWESSSCAWSQPSCSCLSVALCTQPTAPKKIGSTTKIHWLMIYMWMRSKLSLMRSKIWYQVYIQMTLMTL